VLGSSLFAVAGFYAAIMKLQQFRQVVVPEEQGTSPAPPDR
jgi:hypothetical protein